MNVTSSLCPALFREQRHKENLMCMDFLLTVIRLSRGTVQLVWGFGATDSGNWNWQRVEHNDSVDNNNHNPRNHRSSTACTQSSSVNKITQLTQTVWFHHPFSDGLSCPGISDVIWTCPKALSEGRGGFLAHVIFCPIWTKNIVILCFCMCMQSWNIIYRIWLPSRILGMNDVIACFWSLKAASHVVQVTTSIF